MAKRLRKNVRPADRAAAGDVVVVFKDGDQIIEHVLTGRSAIKQRTLAAISALRLAGNSPTREFRDAFDEAFAAAEAELDAPRGG